jgi:predicted transcriptional regulator of viral defense system
MIKTIEADRMGRLGPKARQFLATMAGTDRRLFRAEEAVKFWSSRQTASDALSRLVDDGWLERIERGLYLIVPLEAGPERRWTGDPKVIASQLVSEGAAAYWTALHHWGMTEQVPRTVFIQSRKRKFRSQVTILGVQYQFILITSRKFFGTAKQWSDGAEFRITDREKSIIDALDRPDLCGGLPVVAAALARSDTLDWDRLDQYLERFQSGAIYKRLGYLVERLEVPVRDMPARLTGWRRNCSKGIALLDPRGPRKGPVDSRWRVRVNVSALEKQT